MNDHGNNPPTKFLGELQFVLQDNGVPDPDVDYLEDKDAVTIYYESDSDDTEVVLGNVPDIAGLATGVLSENGWPGEVGQIVVFATSPDVESGPEKTNLIRWTAKAEWLEKFDRGELSEQTVVRRTIETATLIQNDGTEVEADPDISFTESEA